MRTALREAALLAGLLLTAASLADVAIAQGSDGPAVDVTTAALSDLTIADERSVSGEVSARHRALLAAEVTGRIVALGVDTGDTVRKGDVLVRIDPTVYELALRRAEAELASVEAEIERAQSRLGRIEALASRDYASEDELQIESTSLAVLERTRDIRRVARDQARVELARTRVLAPFDGFIAARDGQIGNWVAPGTALLTLAESTDREVIANLHPEQAKALPAALDLRFKSSVGVVPLRIIRVSPVIDPVSRMQTVRFAFEGEAERIGALGEVRWRTDGGLIPADHVLLRDGQLGIFIADGNRARFVALPDAREGRPASHDLPPGTAIIVDGRQRVRDGDLLRIARP